MGGLLWKKQRWNPHRKRNAMQHRRRVEHLEEQLKKPYYNSSLLEVQQQQQTAGQQQYETPVESMRDVLRRAFNVEGSLTKIEIVDKYFKERYAAQKQQ